MNADLQQKLDRILALCQQVRETRAKMTPGPWKWDGKDLWHIGESYESKDDPHLYTGINSDERLQQSPRLQADKLGIALEHNVSLALVEMVEIFIQHEIEHGNMFSTKENPSTRLLQRIADIWQKLGLI